MNKIQFIKNENKYYARVEHELVNGKKVFLVYRGRTLHELPAKFGAIIDPQVKKDGDWEWFNHGGLTYILEG
jgi:hypothetical protein